MTKMGDPPVNLSTVDIDSKCTKNDWKSSYSSNECTFRLALLYCITRVPWNFEENNRCRIVFPYRSVISFLKKFHVNEILAEYRVNRRLWEAPKANIIVEVNFQDSRVVVNDDISFRGLPENFEFRFQRATVLPLSSFAQFILSDTSIIALQSMNFNSLAVKVRNSTSFLIDNSTISKVVNRQLSALDIINSKDVIISNSTFFGNSKKSPGGAVKMVDVGHLAVIGSQFKYNSASHGAAVAMHRVSRSNFLDSTFNSNNNSYAGTVYWLYGYMAMPNSTNCTFVKNNAGLYGDAFASSLCCLHPSINYYEYVNYVSGAVPLALNVSTVDAYNQIIPYNKKAIVARPLISRSKCDAVMPPMLWGKTEKLMINGFSYWNIGASCVPGGLLIIRFSSYLQRQTDLQLREVPVQYFRDIRVRFRFCERGEVYDFYSVARSTCTICTDSFSLATIGKINTSQYPLPIELYSRSCSSCPPNAGRCYKDQIYLLPGTWRHGDDSFAVLLCQSVYACLGGNVTGEQLCADGHTGPLCGVCKPNFFLSNKKECIPCDNRWKVIIATTVALVIFGYLGYLLYLKIAIYLDDNTTLIVNIFVLVYQVISLGPNSNNTSTDSKSNSYAMKEAIKMLTALDLFAPLSISCFYEYNYLFKLKAYSLGPIFISCGLLLSTLVIKSKSYKSKIDFVVINLLHFVLPITSSIIFDTFKCTDIDPLQEFSETRVPMLAADLTISCESSLYAECEAFAYIMLLFPIGVPLVFLILMFQRRHWIQSVNIPKSVYTVDVRMKFQLNRDYLILTYLKPLYDGYKSLYWYYEIIELSFKILFTSIIKAFVKDSRVVVILCIFLNMLYYSVLYKLRPYAYDFANTFKQLGQVFIIISYLAVFIVQNQTIGSVSDHYDRYSVLDNLIFATNIVYILVFLNHIVYCIRRNMMNADNNARNDQLHKTYHSLGIESSSWSLQMAKCCIKDVLKIESAVFMISLSRGLLKSGQTRNSEKILIDNIRSSIHVSDKICDLFLPVSKLNMTMLVTRKRNELFFYKPNSDNAKRPITETKPKEFTTLANLLPQSFESLRDEQSSFNFPFYTNMHENNEDNSSSQPSIEINSSIYEGGNSICNSEDCYSSVVLQESSMHWDIENSIHSAKISFKPHNNSSADAQTISESAANSEECPICLEKIEISTGNFIRTSCNHCFHSTCFLENAFRNGFTCPFCRNNLVNTSSNSNSNTLEEDSLKKVVKKNDNSKTIATAAIRTGGKGGPLRKERQVESVDRLAKKPPIPKFSAAKAVSKKGKPKKVIRNGGSV